MAKHRSYEPKSTGSIPVQSTRAETNVLQAYYQIKPMAVSFCFVSGTFLFWDWDSPGFCSVPSSSDPEDSRSSSGSSGVSSVFVAVSRSSSGSFGFSGSSGVC